MRRILRYYRDPDNGRRLVLALLFLILGGMHLYSALKATIWYVWIPPEARGHTMADAAFLLLMALMLAVLVWATSRGYNVPPKWIGALEFSPAFLLQLAAIIIRALGGLHLI